MAGMSIVPRARALMRVAMQSAVVENDTSSNSRLTKRSTNQTERDDNVSALVLACGLRARMPTPPFQDALVEMRRWQLRILGKASSIYSRS